MVLQPLLRIYAETIRHVDHIVECPKVGVSSLLIERLGQKKGHQTVWTYRYSLPAQVEKVRVPELCLSETYVSDVAEAELDCLPVAGLQDRCVLWQPCQTNDPPRAVFFLEMGNWNWPFSSKNRLID